MKKKIYNLLLIASCIAFISCDSFLDIKPKGIVIPESCEDYEKLLNYAQLEKASDSYPNYMTDDVLVPDKDDFVEWDGLSIPLQNLYSFNSIVYGDSETDGLWEYSYNRIYYFNVVASQIMASTDATEEYKKSLRAEALVGRAFEYLTLVNAYAKQYDPTTAATDPGVPLMLDEDINKTNLVRASVQEVYNQIKKDLDEAATFLLDKPKLNAFRASKPVGTGMLARMYLYMSDYKEALKYAKISLGQNNTLLDLKLYKVIAGDKWIGRLDVPARADNPENTYIRLAPYVFGLSGAIYGSEDLISKFDKEKDQRFLLYFTRKIDTEAYTFDLWAPYIYANMAMATPEMYLIAAECEARIGSKENAMTYYNDLRDMRILDNVRLSARDNDEALAMILDERRRELSMNGCMRLLDLKRLNRDPRFAKTITHTIDGVDYQLKPNDAKYILPIPPKVLHYNPEMIPNER